jgi:hypothetical protein
MKFSRKTFSQRYNFPEDICMEDMNPDEIFPHRGKSLPAKCHLRANVIWGNVFPANVSPGKYLPGKCHKTL